MNVNHYIGFDVHKKSNQLLREDCRRDDRGRRHAASDAPGATGVGEKRREPWHGAMQATRFSGWI